MPAARETTCIDPLLLPSHSPGHYSRSPDGRYRVRPWVRTLVGDPVVKHDGDEYLTGRAVFAGDVVLPGMTHAVLVRSTVAHARIAGIDASAARAMPGVVAVLTGDEAVPLVEPVPCSVDPTPIGGHLAEVRCLAVDRVRHVGEPVAAVVAETQADALAAALAVRVDLEPLPLVLDADEAMADDAPLLYPEWGTNRIVGGEMGSSVEEVDAAIAAADHVLEGVLRSHRGNAAPMETRTHVASWDEATGPAHDVGDDAEPASAALDARERAAPLRVPGPRHRAARSAARSA